MSAAVIEFKTANGWSKILGGHHQEIERAIEAANTPPDRIEKRGTRKIKLYKRETIDAAHSQYRKQIKERGGSVGLKDRKLEEEIRKLRIANDLKEKRLVPLQMVLDELEQYWQELSKIIERKLVEEYPIAVSGMDPPQSRIYGRKLGDSIREEFRRCAERIRI